MQTATISSTMDFENIEAPMTTKAYMMCAFAAFAGILFGYDSGYIASVLGMDEFKEAYGHLQSVTIDGEVVEMVTYSTWQKALIVSILSCGTFFGALISGILADWLGRRSTIILACCVFLAGVIVQLVSLSVAALVVGRLISGLGVGFISAVTIMYMSEVAPRNVRGALVSSYQFAITVGIMLASCVGFATQDRGDTGAFRVPIGIQML